jgi:hypothetical protein
VSFDLQGLYAEAISIPVLYADTGLYPKNIDSAKKLAEKLAREIAWKQYVKTTFIAIRWHGFQVYIDRELVEKFSFEPRIDSRQDMAKTARDIIILSRAYYREWKIIVVVKFVNGIAVVVTG